jgi:hypothetical protein
MSSGISKKKRLETETKREHNSARIHVAFRRRLTRWKNEAEPHNRKI